MNRLSEWFRLSARPDAKPRFKQLLEIIRLAGSGRYSPGEYWVYGFYHKGVGRSDMLEFMPSQVHYSKHLAALIRPMSVPILENKWLFHLHFTSQSISLPECYGVFDPDFGFTTNGQLLRSGADLARLLKNVARPIIAKPVLGSQGRGVMTLEPMTTDAGETAERLAELSRSEKGGGIILQEKLEQHEELRELSPTAAINLRLITLVRKSGPVLTSASMRIGRVGATMSNASQGGLLGQVNTETGEITAVRNGLYFGSELVEHHPDTGVRIVGQTVPDWDSVRQVCIAAAGRLPGAATVGWDVILTPQGPKLLEANHDWDMISEQVFGVGYLARNRDYLREHGLEFPEDTLPRWRPTSAIAFLRRDAQRNSLR